MNVELGNGVEIQIAEKFFVPTTSGGQLSVAEMRQRLTEDEMGKAFFEQDPRYYKSFPVTKGKSIEYIGNDAYPVMHQFELADRHLMTILEAEYSAQTLWQPTEENIALLHCLCSFHDIGEIEHARLIEAGLTPIGDIPAGMKTTQDRRNEERNIRYLFSYFFSDVDPQFLKRMEAIMAHKPLAGDEFLHEIYEAAHNLQTLETATNATASSKREGIPDEDRISLARLGEIVTNSCVVKLDDYRYLTAVDSSLMPQTQPVRHTVTGANQQYHLLCCPEIVVA